MTKSGIYNTFHYWGIPIRVLLLALPFSGLFPLLQAVENGSSDFYSVSDEHRNCDHIITTFVDQIMSQKSPSCEESDVFPKPGSCSVFFKCVRSGSRLQPFVEYCSVGYNFIYNVCVPNTNSTDCPQFTCRIPDATNALGNELEFHGKENNKGNDFMSLPLVITSTTSSLPPAQPDISSSTTEKTVSTKMDGNYFMKMTQPESEKSAGSSSCSTGGLSLVLMIAISFL